MPYKIPATSIYMDEAMKRNIIRHTREILDSGQVMFGPFTKLFEETFAKRIGMPYGVACASDTAAIEIILKAWKQRYGWRDGDVVLLPANALYTCVTAIRNAGLQPALVDIDVDAGIFPTVEQVRDAIQRETSNFQITVCFLAVYSGGYVGRDIFQIAQLCMQLDVKLLEDTSHCVGTTFETPGPNGKRYEAGSIGDASVWCFYATKLVQCHEGGMILCQNEEDAAICRALRNYGRRADFDKTVPSYEGGLNWHLPEVLAAIGYESTLELNSSLVRRGMRLEWYKALLLALEERGVRHIEPPEGVTLNGYRMIVMIDGMNNELRQHIETFCKERGVSLPGRVYDVPVHRSLPSMRNLGVDLDLSGAEYYCHRHMSLPLSDIIKSGEINFVVDTLRDALEAYRG